MAQAGLGQQARARRHRSAAEKQQSRRTGPIHAIRRSVDVRSLSGRFIGQVSADLAGVRKDGRKEGGPAPVLMAELWQGLYCG